MANHGVIVKRLNAIENLGSMDVLCTDKTGTLTKGVVQLDQVLDFSGQISESVLRLAYLNAHYQTGLPNMLDEAIIASAERSDRNAPAAYRKLDEIPYDFVRKRLSIVVQQKSDSVAIMISKGALQHILTVCDRVQTESGIELLTESHVQRIQQQFTAWSKQGYRVLGVAQKTIELAAEYTRDDEHGMVFCGFLGLGTTEQTCGPKTVRSRRPST